MQVAIVTGASSGIGLGCATRLAGTGMAVLGTGRDPKRLAELETAIGDPDRVATVAVDLTDDDAPRRIVDRALQRWGHIDFLINNAGVGSPKPLHETDDETLDYFLNLMLRAPFRLAREVLPHLPPGSAIINVTSTFAVVGGLRGGILRGQGRADRADHPHRLPIRRLRHPLQCRRAGGDGHPDGGKPVAGPALSQDQHGDDTAPTVGQRRRHRRHRRVPVLAGRKFHQRPDDRRRRRMEFDEVSVGVRADLGVDRAVS